MRDNKFRKAILINYTGRKGGGSLIAYETARGLIEKGENVVAIISKNVENLSEWKKLDLNQLLAIDTYESYFSFFIQSIIFYFKQRKEIKSFTDDLEIKAVYCPMFTLWSYKINRMFMGVKKIVAIHDPSPHSGEKLLLRMHRKVFKTERIYVEADAIIVHSKSFVESVEERFNKRGRVFYVPLGRHSMYKNIMNKRYLVDYDKSKINFLFFGRITKYKGLDILAEAYRNVALKRKNITLTIAGNGDFSSFEKSFKKFPDIRIINRWIFDEEVEGFFVGGNIVMICPYTDATQSGVIMVALDYGVPVIASNTGGIPEQIEDGVTGILVTPNNPKELEYAMLQLIDDETLRRRLRLNSMEYVKSFDWDIVIEKIRDIIA